MDVIPKRSRLRYVAAADLDDETIDFDGLKVRSPAGEKLGDVDGAIVDVDSGRPYYVVVDGGGLFHSKHYLVPIGHLRLDHDNDALVADLTRERVDRFPGFDPDQFDELSDAELERIHRDIAACCCPGETARPTGTEQWSHHRLPDWWKQNYYHPVREEDRRPTATRQSTLRDQPLGNTPLPKRDIEPERVGPAEAVVAREGGETSPHVGGRAEPGDVIGVETGGERTYLGDTAADENARRREAEKAAGKQADADLDRAKRH